MTRSTVFLSLLLAACTAPNNEWGLTSIAPRADSPGASAWSVTRDGDDVVAYGSNGDEIAIRQTESGVDISAPGCALHYPSGGLPTLDGDDLETCFAAIAELHRDVARDLGIDSVVVDDVVSDARDRSDAVPECARVDSWKRSFVTCTGLGALVSAVAAHATRGRAAAVRAIAMAIPVVATCGIASYDTLRFRDYCENGGNLTASARVSTSRTGLGQIHLTVSVDSDVPSPLFDPDKYQYLFITVQPPEGQPYAIQAEPIRAGDPRAIRFDAPVAGPYRITVYQSWRRPMSPITVLVPRVD